MIHRDEGEYWIECQVCGNCHDLEVESFGEAISEVKENGYRAYKDAEGDWCHVCLPCQEEKGC